MKPAELMELCVAAEPPTPEERESRSGFLAYLLRLKRTDAVSAAEMRSLAKARREGEFEWFTESYSTGTSRPPGFSRR